MNSFLLIMENFFRSLDWNLVIAGFGIIFIFTLMVYLILIIVSSYQNRRKALNVSLPVLDDYGNNVLSEPQFKELKELSLELVSSDDDVINELENKNNDKSFLTALTLETKKYIPVENEEINMPEVKEDNYEVINLDKEKFATKRTKQTLDKIRKIAQADGKEIEYEDVMFDNIGDGEGII